MCFSSDYFYFVPISLKDFIIIFSAQVEVLHWLSSVTGYLDLSRVAIHGWSYGGYLSLMGLVQYPSEFKLAVAGAPVTSWQLYDTGYTERYLDRPSVKPNGYKLGSILNFVGQLPDEEGRLMIMHGTMDENVHFMQPSAHLINLLIKHGKPYQLQVEILLHHIVLVL